MTDHPNPDGEGTAWTDRTEACQEQFTSERNETIRKELVEHVESTPVVEVGCGTGELEKHIDGKYIGVDFTAEFEPDIHANATALPLADNAVPTVVTKNCLQHIVDYELAIEECCRVASERVIAVERVHNFETQIHSMTPCLRRRFSPADLREQFERAGGPVEITECERDERLDIVVTDLTDTEDGDEEVSAE